MKNVSAHIASARKVIAAAAAVVAYLLANGLLSPERAHAASVYIGAVALILVYAVPNAPTPVKGIPVYSPPGPVDVPVYSPPAVSQPGPVPTEPVPTAPPAA